MRSLIVLLLFVLLSLNSQAQNPQEPEVIKCAKSQFDYILTEDGDWVMKRDWIAAYGAKTFRKNWGTSISFEEADHIKIDSDTLWNYKESVKLDERGSYYWSRVIHTRINQDDLIDYAVHNLDNHIVNNNKVRGKKEGVFTTTRDNKLWTINLWKYNALVEYTFKEGKYRIIAYDIVITPIINYIFSGGMGTVIENIPIEETLADCDYYKFVQLVEDIDYTFYKHLLLDSITFFEDNEDW